MPPVDAQENSLNVWGVAKNIEKYGIESKPFLFNIDNIVDMWTSSDTRMRITYNGNIGIWTVSPTSKLDINGDNFRLRTSKTPATSGDTGDICWDADYVYVCTTTDTWKRSALTTWP